VVIGIAGIIAVPQMVHVGVRHASETKLLEAYQPWVLAAAIIAAAGGAWPCCMRAICAAT
jgi:hypothetical protein